MKKFQYNYTEINFFGENNKLLLFFLAKIPCGDSDVIPADSDEKTLYNLRYIQNTRVDEIALALKISRPAASMRLVRLKTKITDMVTRLDFEKGG